MCDGRNSRIFFLGWIWRDFFLHENDLKYCRTNLPYAALHIAPKLIQSTESARLRSSASVQFRRVNILRHSAAVPACNVERSVHWNHRVVFGAVEDGWTHRKANHQTWGTEIGVGEGGGAQVKEEDIYWAGICSPLKCTSVISTLTRHSLSHIVTYTSCRGTKSPPTHQEILHKLPLCQPLQMAAMMLLPWFITNEFTLLTCACLIRLVENVPSPLRVQSSLSQASHLQPIIY